MTEVDADSDNFDVSPDQVDEALDTLWKGRSRAFEKLLDGHDTSGTGVDEMFGGAVSQGLPPTSGDPPPTIANFTILGEIGRGGMGVIYEARQHHPDRLVALKVTGGASLMVRSGHSPKAQQVRLFEREIASLARLKHPGIAAIHEAGVTEDGRPFFAMELIRGKTLLEFVRGLPSDAKSESIRIRTILRLFENICGAINYAHQRGVIHRDLKPSNVMVADDTQEGGSASAMRLGPAVKVLDFGLARITDADVSVTVTTDAGQIRGTLAYMAPEQIQGDQSEVDIRSDVYSLGVLLFEMLTGRLPYDIKHTSVGQVIRVICETSPTRPSLFCPWLRGDLETILFKALSKDFEQRYQNVSALAEDVARFLSNQPILARPHSSFYQLRKLVARHRVTSFAVLAVVIVSVVGFVVSASLYADTKKAQLAESSQRKLAEQRLELATVEADKAKAVTAFVAEMLASADPGKQGRDVKVIDVLDRAADRLTGALQDQPGVEASIRQVLGITYSNLGAYTKAETQLDTALRMHRERLGDEHADTLGSLDQRAQLYATMGRYNDAESLYRSALDTSQETRGGSVALTLQISANLAGLYIEQGRYDEAEPLLDRVIRAQVELLGEDHLDTLATLRSQGELYAKQGLRDKAESNYNRVVEALRRMRGDEHPDTLVAESHLGLLYVDQGRYSEAEVLYARILEVHRRILGERHADTVASANNLAMLYLQQGRFDEAEPLYLRSLAVHQSTFGDDHPDTMTAMNNLALLYWNQERYDLAEPLYDQTLTARKRILGKDHPETLQSMNNLAALYWSRNWLDKAEPLLLEAYESRRRTLGEEHPRTLSSGGNLAAIYKKQNRYDEALPLYAKALQVRTKTLGIEHPDTLFSANGLGSMYNTLERFAEAHAICHNTLGVCRRTLGEDHPETRYAMLTLSRSLVGLERFKEAEQLALQLHAACKASSATTKRETTDVQTLLKDIYIAWGKPERVRRVKE